MDASSCWLGAKSSVNDSIWRSRQSGWMDSFDFLILCCVAPVLSSMFVFFSVRLAELLTMPTFARVNRVRKDWFGLSREAVNGSRWEKRFSLFFFSSAVNHVRFHPPFFDLVENRHLCLFGASSDLTKDRASYFKNRQQALLTTALDPLVKVSHSFSFFFPFCFFGCL